jgi:fumarylpyruvate hydrolase
MFDVSRPAVPVEGSSTLFPVRRVFCVGKNYGRHAAEMGEPDAKPAFFGKPADAVFSPRPGADALRYPLATEELHYEAEMVVALKAGGEELSEEEAAAAVFGIAAGCDLTRRDRQREAKAGGQPWEVAKGMDQGAALGPIRPVDAPPREGSLRLAVNGELRQDGRIEDMTLGIPALLVELSRLFELKAGDLVFTGTPEGVGPLVPGDAVSVELTGCAPCRFEVVPR